MTSRPETASSYRVERGAPIELTELSPQEEARVRRSALRFSNRVHGMWVSEALGDGVESVTILYELLRAEDLP
jgi:hypothetical protein